MHNTFFTSDHHFGHANILEYESEARPFASLEIMHEKLIEGWNSVVKPMNIVYHLGDFCFGKKNIAIAKLLNGRRRLIMGNHDVYPINEYLPYFEKIFGCSFYHELLLTHIPVHPNHARALINVHGHLHSKITEKDPLKNQPLYVNVSVEQCALKPISYEEVLLRAYRSYK